MKKFLILVIGLAASYPIFYFLAYNGNYIFKIIFGLVAGGSWFIFLYGLTSLLKNKSYYEELSSMLTKLTLVVSLILAIVSYETFEELTFGSKKDQSEALSKSNSVAIAKITEVEHFSAKRIRRKDYPEYWEVKYQFSDANNKPYTGIYRSMNFPTNEIGDTITVKYVKETPEINEQLNITIN